MPEHLFMPAPVASAAEMKPFRIHAGAAALACLAENARSLTPFQEARFLAPLLLETGELDSFRLIEISAGDGALFLPVSLSSCGPFRFARITGGKHASFHAPGLAGNPEISAQTLRATLVKAGREAGIDAFIFSDCPVNYAGRDNPLTILPRQSSPSSGWAVTLDSDADALLERLSDKEYRKKLRHKVNRLAGIGVLKAGWAEAPEERTAVFEKLFEWKAARFGEMGIDDPFAAPGMREFLTRAVENGAMRLFTLHAGERLVAALAGASAGGCFSGMLNGHENEFEIARTSPGEQLVVQLIRTLAAEGYRQFDLGVGEARYKMRYCPERIALVDSAIGVSAKGFLAARAFLIARAAKRIIKQNPRLMEFFSRMRRLGGR